MKIQYYHRFNQYDVKKQGYTVALSGIDKQAIIDAINQTINTGKSPHITLNVGYAIKRDGDMFIKKEGRKLSTERMQPAPFFFGGIQTINKDTVGGCTVTFYSVDRQNPIESVTFHIDHHNTPFFVYGVLDIDGIVR